MTTMNARTSRTQTFLRVLHWIGATLVAIVVAALAGGVFIWAAEFLQFGHTGFRLGGIFAQNALFPFVGNAASPDPSDSTFFAFAAVAAILHLLGLLVVMVVPFEPLTWGTGVEVLVRFAGIGVACVIRVAFR